MKIALEKRREKKKSLTIHTLLQAKDSNYAYPNIIMQNGSYSPQCL